VDAIHRKDVLVVHSCKYNLYFSITLKIHYFFHILKFQALGRLYIVNIIIIIIYVLDSAGSL